MESATSETVINISNLSRRFGSKAALDGVSLAVPRGTVFGLVGENGAGKSTLIKHILGLWRAESGAVRVFGFDPVSDPVSVLSRIGYLSEQPDLPEWMRVSELIRYTQAFYPKWDARYAEELRVQFGLLLAAQAHRPELLLLDEPSSGLDPIVRNDILAAVIRTVADEGRTVFFSSHLLEEIERVSDHLAMLHQGQVVLCGPLDEVKSQHLRVTLRFEAQQLRPPVVPGALNVNGAGRDWTIICNRPVAQITSIAEHFDAEVVDADSASLNEIFIAHAGVSLPKNAGLVQLYG
jgi:ABC-2 type transport system ATP-binding protein